MRKSPHTSGSPGLALFLGGVTVCAIVWASTRQGPVVPTVKPPVVPVLAPTSGYALDIVDTYGIDYALAERVVQVAQSVRIQDPRWLATVINFESRFDPTARNSSGATGLLQFMPETARGLSTTTTAISRMSAMEQMNYVERYYQQRWIANKAPFRSQLDTFMAVFWPAAIGKGPGYRFPSRVPAHNPGIYTAGDYLRKALASAP